MEDQIPPWQIRVELGGTFEGRPSLAERHGAITKSRHEGTKPTRKSRKSAPILSQNWLPKRKPVKRVTRGFLTCPGT
jgi:hypothetical protein